MSSRRLCLVLCTLIAASASAQERWSDDFRTVHNLHAIDNVAQRRAFGRIPTRPDVRINTTDPAVFTSSADGRALGRGWFPVIHRLRNGDLLCAHREGIEHGMAQREARAVVDRSTDGGRTWTGPVVILQEAQWGISPMQLYQLRDGSIWANLRMRKVAGESKGKGRTAVMRSADNGATWQQIGDKGGYIACEMSNGELLWLIGGPGPSEPGSRWPWSLSRATRTSRWKDGKVIWSEDRVHHELGPTSDEWMVAETDRAGELVAMMRQQQHTHYFATAKSYDYGRTWTDWRDSDVYIGPIPCRPSIRSMGDERMICTFGQRWIGRTFAAVSTDRGRTWDVANRQVILHSPYDYHASWDSHYTDIARAEGPLWLGVDYIASPRDRARQPGIYGTFIDERFFRKTHAGLQLAYTHPAFFPDTVGLWRFDELDGDFAHDDINGNYGEVRGPERVDGHLAGALKFDGKDDAVLIFDDASMRVPRFFGISAWINTPDPGKEQTIASKAPAYTFLLKDGVPHLEIGKGWAKADLKEPLKAGTWHHVAVTHSMRYNYTRVTFYLNGREMSYMKLQKPGGRDYFADSFLDGVDQTDQRLVASDPRFQESNRRKVATTDCLAVGMDNNLKTRPFTGMIDEVLLHSGPLKSSLGRAAYERAFRMQGYVTSVPLQRPAGSKWTTFNARATEAEHIHFSLLDRVGKVLARDVKSEADISGIDADVIVLRADFASDGAGLTPVLHEWSVGATTSAPQTWHRPVPDQTAALTGKVGKVPLMPRVDGVDDIALRIAPKDGVNVNLYRVPVGTKATLVFDLDRDPANITKAWLELLVDDIDDPKEATIILNGKHRIVVAGSVLGESDGHRGALVVPPDALVKGRNVFEFTFSDNLNGTTEGYSIVNAALAVLPKELLPL